MSADHIPISPTVRKDGSPNQTLRLKTQKTGLSYFAIDQANKWRYTPAAPQGVNGKRSLKISSQHSAISIQPKHESRLRRSADWDWVWDWAWVTQASRLGDAWSTQASRLGHPWVELNKWFYLQQKLKKWGWGAERAYRRHRRNRRTKTFNHKGHEGTQRRLPGSPTSL